MENVRRRRVRETGLSSVLFHFYFHSSDILRMKERNEMLITLKIKRDGLSQRHRACSPYLLSFIQLLTMLFGECKEFKWFKSQGLSLMFHNFVLS